MFLQHISNPLANIRRGEYYRMCNKFPVGWIESRRAHLRRSLSSTIYLDDVEIGRGEEQESEVN